MTKKKESTLATQLKEMKSKATRVNANTESLAHARASTIQPYSSRVVRGNQAYTPRERAPGEALPPAFDVWERGIYRTGDGDVGVVVRPGSMDFLKCPSKGIG